MTRVWLRLSLPPRRAVLVSAALVIVFMAVHLLAILCVGAMRADSARRELALNRSGPVAAELAAIQDAPRDGTQFLRSSLVIPTSRGGMTWTRLVPWNGPAQLPAVAAADLTPGAVLVSPQAQRLLRTEQHLQALFSSDRIKVLPAGAVAGPDELVVVSILPKSAYRQLGAFEQVGQAVSDARLQEAQPAVAPRSATTPARVLLLATVLLALGLTRLVALSRSTALATLRLLGLTQRSVKALVVVQAASLSLAAGLLVVPVLLALKAALGSLRFLSVEYRLTELLPGLALSSVVILAVVAVGGVVSVLGLRRLEAEPLAVRLRSRREVPVGRVPLLWIGGVALLIGVAYTAPRWAVPDALLLALEVIGVVAVLAGVAGSMALVVRASGRALRAPLPLFIAGKQLTADPGASVRAVLSVGGIALAIGLAGALGPASFPSASTPPWTSALQLRVPDGNVQAVSGPLVSALGVERVGVFAAKSFSAAGGGRDLEVFAGTCADLARSGVRAAQGSCRPGHVIHVGSAPPPLGTKLSGFLGQGPDSGPADLPVSGVSDGPQQPWLFLATNKPPAQANTVVVRHDQNERLLGTTLTEATRSGAGFEIVAPELDRRAEAYQNLKAQETIDALGVWLILLAAVAAVAGATVAVVERRSTLTALRYAGVGRAALSCSVGVTLAAPMVIVAAFGGANGYLVGAVFGSVLDSRSLGPIAGVVTATGLLLLVSSALACAVGTVVAAGVRPMPQDARLS